MNPPDEQHKEDPRLSGAAGRDPASRRRRLADLKLMREALR